MKSLVLTISILSATTYSFSQKLQIYSGAFEGGKATYQYYENDQYERVYHGDFKYQSEGLTVTGKFVNGKKDGIWNSPPALVQFRNIYIKELAQGN